mgnify:CR=1 FL=1
MIQKRKGTNLFDVSCDSCSTGCIEVEAENFKEAVQEIKRKGWTIEKQVNGEWEHYCNDCS